MSSEVAKPRGTRPLNAAIWTGPHGSFDPPSVLLGRLAREAEALYAGTRRSGRYSRTALAVSALESWAPLAVAVVVELVVSATLACAVGMAAARLVQIIASS